jgi:propanediol dehydratase large subunit
MLVTPNVSQKRVPLLRGNIYSKQVTVVSALNILSLRITQGKLKLVICPYVKVRMTM